MWFPVEPDFQVSRGHGFQSVFSHGNSLRLFHSFLLPSQVDEHRLQQSGLCFPCRSPRGQVLPAGGEELKRSERCAWNRRQEWMRFFFPWAIFLRGGESIGEAKALSMKSGSGTGKSGRSTSSPKLLLGRQTEMFSSLSVNSMSSLPS